MEEVVALHGLPIAHVHGERLAAVGARALDAAVAVQSGTDRERVPGAVRVPLASARLHAPSAGHAREGVEHPDLEGVTLEDERVRIVQAAKRSLGFFAGQTELCGGIACPWRLSGLDEAPIQEVANLEVELVQR